MKGSGFHTWKYMNGYGNVSFRSVKGPKGLKDAFHGCEKVDKTF